jgi:hypothetical protein
LKDKIATKPGETADELLKERKIEVLAEQRTRSGLRAACPVRDQRNGVLDMNVQGAAIEPGETVDKLLMQKMIVVMPDQVSPSVLREACLMPDQRSAVLDPNLQGAPLSLGDGGVWRWMPVHPRGKRVRYLCIHRKYKANCKECGGSGICEHNRHRRFCQLCKGSSLCTHGIQKSRCTVCTYGM